MPQSSAASASACDVTDEQSAINAIAKVRDKFGVARILVNCAGVGPAKRILGRDGPMPLADYRKVIEINLIGTFNMLRLAAADMSKADPLPDGERGVIVSTASVAAFEGQVGQAAYSSSKGGVAALTLPAARELSQFAIRVAAIAPGIFGTPMLTGAAAGNAGQPRRLGAVPEAPRRAARIRRTGARHRAQRLSQRRSDPPRRRACAWRPCADTKSVKRFRTSCSRKIMLQIAADRMGRLRPGRDRLLSALFRDVRSFHHHADHGGHRA